MNNWKNRFSRGLIVLLALLFLAPYGLMGMQSLDLTVWDAKGGTTPPTQNLCSHGYQWGIDASKPFTIADATSLASIEFDIWFTSCQNGGSYNLYLNGTLIGTAANPNPQYDCSCTPNAVKWPYEVTISDAALLNSAFVLGGSNTLRVQAAGAGSFAISHYGATINYNTTLHPVIDPPSASIEAGQTVSFDASGSWSDAAPIVSYSWDFDDGTQGTGAQVDHTFENDGIYNVKLTIEDEDGMTADATAEVRVVGPVVGAVEEVVADVDQHRLL